MAEKGLQVHVNEISPVLVELEITVPWDEVGKRLDRMYARVGRDAHIRGFRKGKVPRAILERTFGPSVTREVLSELVEARLMEAIRGSGRRAVATRSVEPGPIEPGRPLKLTAKVEVLPKIDELVREGLVAERPSLVVKDEEVDAELERLRQGAAELAPFDPPRPAQKGDVVLVDYQAFLEGEATPFTKIDGRRIELGVPELLTGLSEAIEGASEGEHRTAPITFPEDHGRAELRGKKARFEIEVREVREKVLPALDDEFARDLGEHETLEALRASVRSRLEKARAQGSERATEQSVLADLARKNPIPLPTALVEAQVDGMEQELLRIMRPESAKEAGRYRLSDEIRTELRARAEERVRGGLLVTEIARRDKVEVSEEEVDAYLGKMAEESGRSLAKVRADFSKDDRMERLRSELLEKKVLAGLLEKAEIREVAAEAGHEHEHDHDHDQDHDHDHDHDHGHE